ncbi:MAG: beta strand repeat-containing protein, partial [Acidimicrobiales bacterium]
MAATTSGIATFGGCSISGPVGSYTLSATDTADGLVVATSSAITLTPGTPTHLAFVQGPSSAQAGSAITPAVTVAVEDASGNVETSDNATTVSLAIGTNPGSGILTGGAAVTVVNGVATFSGLSINKVGAGYTLTASSTPTYTAATSSAFDITPGAANRLVFLQGPSNAAAGAAISPAVTVAVEDANGNVETSDNATTVSLAIGTNPGSGTLTGGAAVTVVNGVATFSGLSINKVGAGYTLTASSTPAYSGATSSSFTITPGPASQLAFIAQPSNTAAGSAISPAVTVAVEDANGNVETSDNATTVSLAIGTNPGSGTLTGGAAVTVVNGVATFSGLSIDEAGTGYTLTASSTPSYTPATSSAFTVTPGAATKLAFITQPSSTAAGSAISPAVTVAVEDGYGNVETGDSTTTVALAIGTNPSSGTLTGGAAVTVVNGVATFSGLSIDNTGTGYTLTATSTPSYTSATSTSFTITPGTANKLVFTAEPAASTTAGATISPAVTVAVEDANGNVVTSDNATTITLAIGANPGGGTLTGGGAVTVVNGVATFSGLSIDKVGTGYTLVASSTPSNTQATSTTFAITVGVASKLGFIAQPSTTAAGSAVSPAVTVAVEDANGNVETTDNTTTIALAIGTNPGGGTLTGGAAVTVVNGIATFSGLSIDKAGIGYTLAASSTPTYTAATSAAFTITSGAATQLAFTQQPSNAAAGSAISPAVTVAVEDANGNVVTSDNATTITLAIGTNPGGGTLTGGAAVTVVNGVATFSGLSINKVGTGYTLTASSTPTYAAATSAAFTITVGTAAQLAFIEQPSNAQAGAVLTPAVTVAVEDANGNIETGDNTTTIALAIGTNPGGGTLTGGSAITVAAGVATFPGLSIDLVGVGYTLTASSTPSYAAATSSAFTITVGAASHLAFVQQPTSAVAATTIAPAVTVAVEDANGNVETTDNTTTIALAIGANPGSGTLTGGAAVTVAAGVATFSGLSIDKAGIGYTLTASSTPTYTAATSSAFTITPGAPTQLAFTT